MPKGDSGRTEFRVIDAMDHPQSGRILRVKLKDGPAPSVRSLKGTTLRARSPRGDEGQVTVLGFSLTGGKVTDARFRETGRLDLHVEEESDPPVSLRWILSAGA
ncbi:MAG: hypothetical protein EA421_17220 [Gemmatimonadales bacterium]|nr:MAG: hypothetical protein EA421_17220 [Gemmatimonadales bacterium]